MAHGLESESEPADDKRVVTVAVDSAARPLIPLHGRRGEWAVVAFGVGVALYFGLPVEPVWQVLAVGLAVLLAVAWRRGMGDGLIVAVFILAGLTRAGWHSEAVETPTLRDTARTYTVEGWVEDVERGSQGLRWIVRVQSVRGMDDPPHRLRVTVRDSPVRAGEGVRFRGRLRAMPAPAIPGGYDSARAAHFRKLGGSGVMFGDAEVIDLPTRGWEAVSRAHSRWRYGVAQRVLDSAPPETAGLQASLLTGVRAWTPPEQTKALRDAGLAHIIAISGLHMSVFAGSVYALLCLVFCGLSRGRECDMRKVAAICAVGVATVYLALSGASVSAQRAYIMVAIWFAAIVLEREPFSLRSVAVAAFVTLMIHPESLLSAGFHMSFAAVTALIVVYGWWNARREFVPGEGFARRVWRNLVGMGATSFIAGTATGGFALLHFGRVARWGLFANVAAMPLFTIAVMPAAMLSLVLMPFGLERLGLVPMGYALEGVLWIAESVAAWPGAVATYPGAPNWALPVFAGGFILLMIGRERMRLAGLMGVAALGLTAFSSPDPVGRISDTGHLTLWLNGQAYSTSARADRFGRSMWEERANLQDVDVRKMADGNTGRSSGPPHDEDWACDDQGCRLATQYHIIAIVHHPADVGEACEDADLVLLTKRSATPKARRGCAADLVDARSLRGSGSLDLYLSPELRLVPVKTKGRKRRPWG